jgi:hypothetical protein
MDLGILRIGIPRQWPRVSVPHSEARAVPLEVERGERGAENVSGVVVLHTHAVEELPGLVVFVGLETVTVCSTSAMVYEAGARRLAGLMALEMRHVALLEEGAVRQHEPAQLGGRRRDVDPAGVALSGERRQVAAVIEMGMREHDAVELRGLEGERAIDAVGLFPVTLVETAIEEPRALAESHAVP